MCGIVGALSIDDDGRIDASLVESMRDRLAHRGPDSAGSWLSADRRIGLGHRRLSIIDLSAAADQPMASADGRYQLVLNGEIYNHAELRRQLHATGKYHWATDHSDTEALLYAWAEWGLDSLHHLRGMFAFAIWDAHDRTLTLVRDRIGVKPLYYTEQTGADGQRRFTFASEIKALLIDPALEPAIDEQAFVDFLSFLTTPGPNTMFRGVNKLAGGHWLRIDARGRRQQCCYWDVLDHVEPRIDAGREELCEELLATLTEAVELRKIGDVPVGVFLSGGVDSSTNAALFSRGETQPIRTFSIGYDRDYGTYSNELDFARQMAEHVGAEHREQRLKIDDLLNFLESMVELQDEPLADPVCVPVYYVSRLARQSDVKVCQVGEGADELFWGYPYWKKSLRLDRLNQLPVPRFAKRLGLRALRMLGREESYYYELLRRGSAGEPIFWGGAEGFPNIGRNRLLSARMRREFGDRLGWHVIEPIHQRFKENCWEDHSLQWMSYLDLKFRLPELLLMRVDKMSMGVSLEARIPFLDHKLVELAMSLPAATKTHGGVLKGLLKQSVRGLIPDSIIDRPKQGFGVPVYEWFLERLGDRARRDIQDFADGTDLIDVQQVVRLFERQRGNDLCILLNVALWWKRFIRR